VLTSNLPRPSSSDETSRVKRGSSTSDEKEKSNTSQDKKPIRVLYSFPHKLGGRQIDAIAWQQAKSLVDAGAEVLVFPGAIEKPLPGIETRPTLARGRVRIPYRLL
jgi:hypothetical protein